MNLVVAFLATFALSFFLSLSLTPLMIYLGKRLKIVAKVSPRRHSEGDRRQVSKLGGVALYSSIVVTILFAQLLDIPRFDPNEVIRLTGFLLGSTVIFVAGILDDVFELPPLTLLAAQILAAGIAIAFMIFIEGFNNPFTGEHTAPWPFAFTVVLTLVWLVGMTNTVNWMDGVDGLATGVVCIAAMVLFVNAAFILYPAQTSVSLLPLAVVGAALGFLPFNFTPARVFLGGGAFLLGYVIGCLSIIGGAKMATILMVMGLPILDAAWQAASRILQGRSPFIGDRGHLHFRLVDMGISQRQIALGYYLFCTIFGTLTLMISSRQFKFVSLLAMAVIILLGFLIILFVPHRKALSPKE